MTVVSKTALPINHDAVAQPMRARRPVDFALLDSASSAFSSGAAALRSRGSDRVRARGLGSRGVPGGTRARARHQPLADAGVR